MSRHTVLIVEDNLNNLILVQDLLEVHGYRTVQVRDGGRVLAMVRREKPDLILMDIQLPTVDGYTLARSLKSADSTGKIPIIAITSLAMENEKKNAVEAGCDEYISKPIDIHRLMELVRTYLPPAAIPEGGE